MRFQTVFANLFTKILRDISTLTLCIEFQCAQIEAQLLHLFICLRKITVNSLREGVNMRVKFFLQSAKGIINHFFIPFAVISDLLLIILTFAKQHFNYLGHSIHFPTILIKLWQILDLIAMCLHHLILLFVNIAL